MSPRRLLILAQLLNDSGKASSLGSGLPSDVRSCHALILSLKTEIQMLHQGQQQAVATLRAQLRDAGESGAWLRHMRVFELQYDAIHFQFNRQINWLQTSML